MSAVESNVQRSQYGTNHVLGIKGLTEETPETMTKLTLGTLSYHADNQNKESLISRPNEDDEDMVSDCESGISGSSNEENASLFGSGLFRLPEENALRQIIAHKFASDMAGFGVQTQIHAIHRNVNTRESGRANLQSYLSFLSNMEKKNNGNANWKYSWYCASKQDINTIVSSGFGHTVNTGIYGRGVYLSPVEYPLQSLQFSTADEDGLRHLLLCRVILGRMEVIHPGSEQCLPSSDEFDSGVDNLLTPTKYIVWSTHMNTHIFPEFVISIRAPPITTIGSKRFPIPLRRPNSPWMPFLTLISTLSQYLAADRIKLLQKYHTDHKNGKITRQELIRRVRQIAGDQLLIRIIKSYKHKLSTSTGSEQSRRYNNNCQQRRGGECACSKNDGAKFCRKN